MGVGAGASMDCITLALAGGGSGRRQAGDLSSLSGILSYTSPTPFPFY